MVRRHNLAMPSKKKKYNARFPAGRIKKIMQTDEEVGKVAQAVPIIISRTLELFVESLLTKSVEITSKRNAKTLSPSHMKQCILAESRFDFLRDLVKNIPDASHVEDRELGQTVSADSSPNSNRFSDSGNASVNPGPSNVVKRPRRSQKKDNGQSSDSGSDHESATKRMAKNTFGNGRNPPKTNFDEELKAFKQRMNHRGVPSPRISPKKNTDGDGKEFLVPNDVNIPFASGECSGNSKRLFNFYTETLPDTSEDDEKERRIKAPAYGSVIQANPEYSEASFGFYKPTSQTPRIVENSPDPSASKSRTNSDSCVPKLHIDLSQGFLSPATVSVLPNDTPGTAPMYHIDLSAMPLPSVGHEHPYTPTVLCPPQSMLSPHRVFGNAAPKKAPPPLQTISLRRSASLPESNVSNFSRPACESSPRFNCPPTKPRIERSSLSFDKSSMRKNEPPLLLPINLVQKSVIASPAGAVVPVHPPAMEIDEDYDT